MSAFPSPTLAKVRALLDGPRSEPRSGRRSGLLHGDLLRNGLLRNRLLGGGPLGGALLQEDSLRAGLLQGAFRLGRYWPVAAVAAGGWLATDLALGIHHWASHSPLPLALGAAGLWWWAGRRQRPQLADTTQAGWLERLEGLQQQFTALEASRPQHQQELAQVRASLERSALELAVIGRELPAAELQGPLAAALRGPMPLRLHWSDPLPAWSEGWSWPLIFEQCELLILHLQLPLSAAELRWIEACPTGQPLWLLVQTGVEATAVEQELAAQLPAGWAGQILCWSGRPEDLTASLQPLAQSLQGQGASLRQQRQLRCLRQLHGRWQAELETLRRSRLQRLQQRTQWIVAAGVVASPLPSMDVLVLAVANGLMLQEMAQLWQCPWSGPQLRAAAVELARASLTLGVMEWSSQTLAGLLKWHGATWLVGSAVQALSAAYLTRVVCRAMADVLALSAGVSEPDLERIKQQAPLLVARAAETERLNWDSFLQQGRQWLLAQPARQQGPGLKPA